jgi:hypothetical protein
MDLDYCIKQYLVSYNSLIDQVSLLFEEKDYRDYLLVLNAEKKDKKWLRGVQFYKLLTSDLFDTFLESKIKLFSHKDDNTKEISLSLFGDVLSLKKIFNNRDDITKLKLWHYLHTMILTIELAQKKPNKDNINKLTELVEKEDKKIKEKEEKKIKEKEASKENNPKDVIKNMLGVDVNNETNDMLEDIIKSFEKTLNNSSGNPFSGIMEISQKISTKYQDKINNGEIEIDKLMSSITKSVPGMDDLLKGGLFNKGDTKKKETVIIDENFSTATVEQGKQDESKPNTNLVNMIKMADSMGVLPGLGGNSEGGMPDFKSMLSGLMGSEQMNDPKMAGLFSMINDLDNLDDPTKAEELKNKMDSFLSNELKLDISQLDSTINNIMNDNKENIDSLNEDAQHNDDEN